MKKEDYEVLGEINDCRTSLRLSDNHFIVTVTGGHIEIGIRIDNENGSHYRKNEKAEDMIQFKPAYKDCWALNKAVIESISGKIILDIKKNDVYLCTSVIAKEKLISKARNRNWIPNNKTEAKIVIHHEHFDYYYIAYEDGKEHWYKIDNPFIEKKENKDIQLPLFE